MGDQVARFEDSFAVGGGAGQQIKIVDGDGAFAFDSLNLDGGFESGQGNDFRHWSKKMQMLEGRLPIVWTARRRVTSLMGKCIPRRVQAKNKGDINAGV